jgi:hypothetical protein
MVSLSPQGIHASYTLPTMESMASLQTADSAAKIAVTRFAAARPLSDDAGSKLVRVSEADDGPKIWSSNPAYDVTLHSNALYMADGDEDFANDVQLVISESHIVDGGDDSLKLPTTPTSNASDGADVRSLCLEERSCAVSLEAIVSSEELVMQENELFDDEAVLPLSPHLQNMMQANGLFDDTPTLPLPPPGAKMAVNEGAKSNPLALHQAVPEGPDGAQGNGGNRDTDIDAVEDAAQANNVEVEGTQAASMDCVAQERNWQYWLELLAAMPLLAAMAAITALDTMYATMPQLVCCCCIVRTVLDKSSSMLRYLCALQ